MLVTYTMIESICSLTFLYNRGRKINKSKEVDFNMATVDLSKKTVNLTKGEKINLTKSSEGLTKILVGLGWDPATSVKTVQKVKKPGFIGKLLGKEEEVIEVEERVQSGANIDCDAWLGLMSDGKVLNQGGIVYYGNLKYSSNGKTVIQHMGDNLTGDGDGDDEQIEINLDKLPAEIDSIVVGVTIYSASSRHQSFGDIQNTFIRIVDEKDNFEICRYDNTDIASVKDSVTFIAGELHKDNNEWHFTAIGRGTKDQNINSAVTNYAK